MDSFNKKMKDYDFSKENNISIEDIMAVRMKTSVEMEQTKGSRELWIYKSLLRSYEYQTDDDFGYIEIKVSDIPKDAEYIRIFLND